MHSKIYTHNKYKPRKCECFTHKKSCCIQMCLKIKPDSTWTVSTDLGSIAWPSIDMIVSWCSCSLISIGHCDAPPVLIVLNRYLLLFLTVSDCNQLTYFIIVLCVPLTHLVYFVKLKNRFNTRSLKTLSLAWRVRLEDNFFEVIFIIRRAFQVNKSLLCKYF